MTPKEILQKWVECFNRYDYDGLGELYGIKHIFWGIAD
jgi:hypothetical protein